MAVLALETKETFVDGWFLVALPAFGRGATENFIGMAGFTCQRSVRTIQREHASVVEIAQPIYAIVAVKASGSELGLVFHHEFGLLCIAGMACDTSLQIKLIHASSVTVYTGNCLLSIIGCMALQTEAGGLVVAKNISIQVCREPGSRVVAMLAVGVEHTLM